MPMETAPHVRTALTSIEDSILRTVNDLHFVTARDITHLLFSKGSLTYSRKILSRLAGGKDYAQGQLLLRFPMPTPTKERVYTLGVKGRDALAQEGYYRPYKFRHLSYGYLMHALTTTRFVAAAQSFCRQHPDYTLEETLLSYDLAQDPVTVDVVSAGKRSRQTVIPDACLLFAAWNQAQERLHPIIVEIDRGSEDKAKWTALLRGRLRSCAADTIAPGLAGKRPSPLPMRQPAGGKNSATRDDAPCVLGRWRSYLSCTWSGGRRYSGSLPWCMPSSIKPPCLKRPSGTPRIRLNQCHCLTPSPLQNSPPNRRIRSIVDGDPPEQTTTRYASRIALQRHL
jgi:hypothetical protein